jgi:hypothetical protein
MNQLWTQLKRWGLPMATRIGVALPLLLGLGAALMLVAIWWIGPQWTWREQQPLASVAHRSVASLVLVLVPLLGWLIVLRTRFRHLQLRSALLLLQASQRLLRCCRIRRGERKTVKARQRIDQTTNDQLNQLALAEEAFRTRLWMSRLPIAFDHASQQSQGAPPTLPAPAAQPGDAQVRSDPHVLALQTQVCPLANRRAR